MPACIREHMHTHTHTHTNTHTHTHTHRVFVMFPNHVTFQESSAITKYLTAGMTETLKANNLILVSSQNTHFSNIYGPARSALFAIQYVNLCQQCGSGNLTGCQLEVDMTSKSI